MQKDSSDGDGEEDSSLGKTINTIIGILQFTGSAISVIVVSLVGIRYILASVEQKAEIKKQAIPIVIGAILLFGAVNLVGAINSFSGSVFGTN